MYKIIPKTKEEIKVIIDGGKRLADVKNNLFFAALSLGLNSNALLYKSISFKSSSE